MQEKHCRVLCYTTFAAKVGRGLSISRATLETLSSGGRESKYNQPTPPPPEGDQACPPPITISYLFLLSLPVSWLCRFLSSARLSKKKEILVPRRRRRRRQKKCKCSGDFHRKKNFPPPFLFSSCANTQVGRASKAAFFSPFPFFSGGERCRENLKGKSSDEQTDGRAGLQTPPNDREKKWGLLLSHPENREETRTCNVWTILVTVAVTECIEIKKPYCRS